MQEFYLLFHSIALGSLYLSAIELVLYSSKPQYLIDNYHYKPIDT